MFVLAKEKSGEVNCEHIYYLCNLLLKTTAFKKQQQQKSPIEKNDRRWADNSIAAD